LLVIEFFAGGKVNKNKPDKFQPVVQPVQHLDI